ncbi:MAG: ABC transporter permease [Gemmatimonas sp.]
MQGLSQDLRYGLRSLLRQPSFTIIAVLTLAIGIGATSAIFSVVDGVLLRPLPYVESERMVRLQPTKFNNASAKDYDDWRRQSTQFEQVAAYLGVSSFNLSGTNDPERIAGMRVSANLFPMLGAKPAVGRLFLEEEDRKGQGKVVLLSYGLWQRKFGGAQSVLNETIVLDNERFAIVGVMPKGFAFADDEAELWIPFAPDLEDMGRGNYFVSVVGKLKSGATIEQAQSDITGIARKLEALYPETNSGMGVVLVPLLESITGKLKLTLFILLGTVGFLLLIACTNVANLLLVRATGRRREIAVRMAHGATTRRIARQLLVESGLLALMGGVLGLIIAVVTTKTLLAIAPEDIPRLGEISVSGRVLFFTLTVSVVTGVLFGMVPAFQAGKANVQQVLKENSRGASGAKNRLRSALVVSEIAIALVLSVGAGLMVKSFVRLHSVNPGFETTNILSFSVTLPYSKYAQAQMPNAFNAATANFFSEALSKVAAVPGVTSVGVTSALPLSKENNWRYIHVEGSPFGTPQQYTGSNYRIVSTNYFASVGMQLLRGRGIDATDKFGSEAVVVVNSAFAKKFYPGMDPINQRFKMGTKPSDPEAWMRVVGVVADVHHTSLATVPVPELYRPYEQSMQREMQFAVRSNIAPELLAPAIRKQILTIDASIPIANVSTMQQLYDKSVAGPRFVLSLLASFSLVALLLAAIGLYGVLSFVVSQRTREMGIRSALGAQARQVLTLVMGEGLRLACVGVTIGLILALAMTRVMNRLLFETSTTDPLTFAVTAYALLTVTAIACYIPARRATRVNAMVAMRQE